MIQAIAGVSPAAVRETTVMTTWPSNAAYSIGRLLGRGFNIKTPGFYIFTPGNLIALASIPLALIIFFWRVAPVVGRRYRLTNRRIVVEKGWTFKEDESVELDRFDAIDIQVQEGQHWYDAGDLLFRLGDRQVFLLEGVSRPEAFRLACWKAHTAYVGVKDALEREKA